MNSTGRIPLYKQAAVLSIAVPFGYALARAYGFPDPFLVIATARLIASCAVAAVIVSIAYLVARVTRREKPFSYQKLFWFINLPVAILWAAYSWTEPPFNINW